MEHRMSDIGQTSIINLNTFFYFSAFFDFEWTQNGHKPVLTTSHIRGKGLKILYHSYRSESIGLANAVLIVR